MVFDQPVVAILNGAAGGGRCYKKACLLLSRLQESVKSLFILPTRYPGHASQLARDFFQQGYRHFISVGGDGTSYEVINGLFPAALEQSVYLGILPLGTGNSFLRDFHIDSPEKAMGALLNWKSRPIDVVKLTLDDQPHFFLNICTLGFSAEVGELRNRHFRAFGNLGYVLGVLVGLLKLRSPAYPLKCDQDSDWDTRSGTMLSFCNSRYTGGTMLMAPEADPGDGLFDFVRFADLGRWRLLRNFPRIFRGSHVQLPEVACRKVQRIEFNVEESIPILLDGEILWGRPQSLEILKEAVHLYH